MNGDRAAEMGRNEKRDLDVFDRAALGGRTWPESRDLDVILFLF